MSTTASASGRPWRWARAVSSARRSWKERWFCSPVSGSAAAAANRRSRAAAALTASPASSAKAAMRSSAKGPSSAPVSASAPQTPPLTTIGDDSRLARAHDDVGGGHAANRAVGLQLELRADAGHGGIVAVGGQDLGALSAPQAQHEARRRPERGRGPEGAREDLLGADAAGDRGGGLGQGALLRELALEKAGDAGRRLDRGLRAHGRYIGRRRAELERARGYA